jgi:geranylgeranyl diphosphate synthase type II
VDVRAYLQERIPLVDAVLDAAIPRAEEPPRELHAAMRHLLFPGGKRLRPVLAMAAAEAVGGSCESALPQAAAVELIHTYSLIHDDLPCMDDDAERRGRPTVHVVFGESTAVLAGDALQAAAFEMLGRVRAGDAPERSLAAVRDLAEAAGSLNLVGGQVDDLAFDPAEARPDRIESVHVRKSAALIAVAIVGGARLAGADEHALALLRRFGERVGVAFQIADDLVDAGESDPCSMVRALGAEPARARATALLTEALGEVEAFGERAEPLRALARYAVWRSE